MINRELTNLYLSHLDLLTEALYSCWTNSFCVETDQLNIEILKEQILSYGLYDHKYAIKKEIPINFINKLEFKTLIWVNEFVDNIDDTIWGGYTELYKQVINEIENNLFELKHKTAQVAYANILLRNLDKSHIHKRKLESDERNMRYRETFEIVLNRKLLAEDKVVIQNEESLEKYPNYDLTARLINHLDFIDKLIELFSCFKIDLVVLAEETKHNLYLFDESNRVKQPKNDLEVSFVNLGKGSENLQDKTLPKFYSTLSDDCLIKIMLYLIHKKKLDYSNTDVWLFWFNRKYIKVPEPLKWKGSSSMLSNIIQHICGESISSTIKTVFCMKKYLKPTKCKYEHSRTHKEIEQIITISKQKNS